MRRLAGSRRVVLLALYVGMGGGLPGGATAEEPSLLAGFATVDLTPARPVPLAGFASRSGDASAGVHDPVRARAMVLSSGDAKLAVVSAEVLSVPRGLKAAVVGMLKDRGFTSANVLVAATDNRSGPGGLSRAAASRPVHGTFDGETFAEVTSKVAHAVAQADEERAKARALWWRRETPPPRATGGAPLPPWAAGAIGDVLRVEDRAGRPVGFVVHVAAHAPVLDARNRRMSAEWPGALAAALERDHPGATALCLARFAWLDDPTSVARADFAAVEAYGERLAARAATRSTDGPVEVLSLAAESREVALPPTVAGRLLGLDLDGVLAPSRTATAEVQVLSLGRRRWIALPGRATKAFARAVVGDDDDATVVSCANDDLGDFVDRAALRESGEDEDRAWFGPGLADRLERACRRSRPTTGPDPRDDLRGLAEDAVGLGLSHDGAEVREFLRAAEDALIGEAERKGASSALSRRAAATGLSPRDWVLPTLVLAARRVGRHVPPAYLDEMEALAAGAGVPYDAVLLENAFLTIAEQTDAGAVLSLPARCTNAALFGDATPLGEPVHVSVLDWGLAPLLRDRARVVPVRPPRGVAFLGLFWPGMVGTLRAMNAAGISVTEESIAAKDDTGMDGVPLPILLRDVAQHARDLDDAVRRVVAAPGTAGYHVTIVDGRRPAATRASSRGPRGTRTCAGLRAASPAAATSRPTRASTGRATRPSPARTPRARLATTRSARCSRALPGRPARAGSRSACTRRAAC
jgi:hypothetical protein